MVSVDEDYLESGGHWSHLHPGVREMIDPKLRAVKFSAERHKYRRKRKAEGEVMTEKGERNKRFSVLWYSIIIRFEFVWPLQLY